MNIVVRIALCLACAFGAGASDYTNFEGPPHNYFTSTPQDRFTRAMAKIADDPRLDRSTEKSFLISLLKILEVPVSSQTLVFSTTSLQLRFISPANPRAVYFNEDIYIGYIPGGRIEAVGIDPALGAIFYIFDIPKNKAEPIKLERSDRCMNCHAAEETGFIPGLVVKSVVPGPSGGTLDSFRQTLTGHTIPLQDRFGGWHVTGLANFTNHWGNLTGRFVDGVIQRTPNLPGQRFDFSKYPANTSDILAHLIHEHQVGFVNRAIEAGYRVRTKSSETAEQARKLVRYILFADEAKLPSGGIEGDPTYKKDFLVTRKTNRAGEALKDLDLATRLFKHRCSYMIYSPAFQGLPVPLKTRVSELLKQALSDGDKEFAYIPAPEKKTIRRILDETFW